MDRRRIVAGNGAALVALALTLASPGFAVDGVIEINQTRALAGSITPGDAPGFPVQIFTSGSYRLTGNLTLPDTNTGGIELNVGRVVIDLNGFTIGATGACSGCPAASCTGGTGRGIYDIGRLEPVAVRNGTILGFGAAGIEITGGAEISNVLSESNGGRGIKLGGGIVGKSGAGYNGDDGFAVGAGTISRSKATCNGQTGIEGSFNSRIVDNTSEYNGADGIFADDGSTVSGNSAGSNAAAGISVSDGVTLSGNTSYLNTGVGFYVIEGVSVLGNTAFSNGSFGLVCGANSGFGNNVINNNNGGNGSNQTSGCTSIGTNLCRGSTTCP